MKKPARILKQSAQTRKSIRKIGGFGRSLFCHRARAFSGTEIALMSARERTSNQGGFKKDSWRRPNLNAVLKSYPHADKVKLAASNTSRSSCQLTRQRPEVPPFGSLVFLAPRKPLASQSTKAKTKSKLSEMMTARIFVRRSRQLCDDERSMDAR